PTRGPAQSNSPQSPGAPRYPPAGNPTRATAGVSDSLLDLSRPTQLLSTGGSGDRVGVPMVTPGYAGSGITIRSGGHSGTLVQARFAYRCRSVRAGSGRSLRCGMVP